MKIRLAKIASGMTLVLLAGCQPETASQTPLSVKNDNPIVKEVAESPSVKKVGSNSHGGFREIPSSVVPDSLVKVVEELCQDLEPPECRKHFLEYGAGFQGDLNDDGQPEYILRATDLGGTGGEPYFIFQKSNDAWAPLISNSGPQGFIGIIGMPRVEILPTIRDGYHDFRLGVTTLYKWNGKSYVLYEQEDWGQLKPESIHVETIHDLDLLWKVRYKVKKQFRLEPEWFNGEPNWSNNVELDDAELGLKWIATFKGGVYATKQGRSFLLMPRPQYSGAEKLELNGDWLLIYADAFIDKEKKKVALQSVAKYNRKTGEFIIEDDWEY